MNIAEWISGIWSIAVKYVGRKAHIYQGTKFTLKNNIDPLFSSEYKDKEEEIKTSQELIRKWNECES